MDIDAECRKLCAKVEKVPAQSEGSDRDGHFCAGDSCVADCKGAFASSLSDSCKHEVKEEIEECSATIEDECIDQLERGSSSGVQIDYCVSKYLRPECTSEGEPEPPDDSSGASGSAPNSAGSNSSGEGGSSGQAGMSGSSASCPGASTCVYYVNTVIDPDGSVRRVYFCTGNFTEDECSMVAGDWVSATTCPARGYRVFCSTNTFFENEDDCINDGAFGLRAYQPTAEQMACDWAPPSDSPDAGMSGGGMGGVGPNAGASGSVGGDTADCAPWEGTDDSGNPITEYGRLDVDPAMFGHAGGVIDGRYESDGFACPSNNCWIDLEDDGTGTRFYGDHGALALRWKVRTDSDCEPDLAAGAGGNGNDALRIVYQLDDPPAALLTSNGGKADRFYYGIWYRMNGVDTLGSTGTFVKKTQ